MAAYVRQPTISPTARKTQGKGGWKIKKQSIPDKSFPSAEARKRAGGTSTSHVQTSKGQRQRDWTSRRSACTPAQPRYGQGLWTEAVERVREEVTWQPSLPATPLRLLPAPLRCPSSMDLPKEEQCCCLDHLCTPKSEWKRLGTKDPWPRPLTGILRAED